MTNEELMYAGPEDQAFYLKCVEGLPTLAGLNGTGKDAEGIPLPYGVGPHSVRCLREIVEISNPKNIFEIGFNMGWSSSLWLNLTSKETKVVSCDISFKEETTYAAKFLQMKYPGRFKFYFRQLQDMSVIEELPFDLCFIDGCHLYEDVVKDIELCAVYYQCPWIAFDDILPQFGPGVQKAIDDFGKLEHIQTIGNISLYKNTTI